MFFKISFKTLGIFCFQISLFFTGINGEEYDQFPVIKTHNTLSPLMERELRGCFDFFWNEWNDNPSSPTFGMTNGDYVGLNKYSPLAIENQGFYFTAIIIGVERGWITREEGEKRILITLKTLRSLKRIKGFWYHFIDQETGVMKEDVEDLRSEVEALRAQVSKLSRQKR